MWPRVGQRLENNSSLLALLVVVVVGLLSCCRFSNALEGNLQVVHAINAGGYEHTDKHGIHYDADADSSKAGTVSDYGNNLLMIGRVPDHDEVLYRTERYHTATFGYDIPIQGDGNYALVLKFCEVYFNAPNMKIFDVVLNRKHKIVSKLDIFAQVGRGTAHEEYAYFTISRGKINYKGELSEIRNNMIRLEFIKNSYDNPKINAFVLFKGDIKNIPKLKPLNSAAAAAANNVQQNNAADDFDEDADDDDDDFQDHIIQNKPNVKRKATIAKKKTNAEIKSSGGQQQQRDSQYEAEQQHASEYNDDEDADDDADSFDSSREKSKNIKTSGPPQPNPYSTDDTMVLLPVFIAIGAFIPLLFCLCKL